MSHMIIVFGQRGQEIEDICVSGDLSALYDQLTGIENRGVNGEGRAVIGRKAFQQIVEELPSHASSNQGVHIVQRCLAQILVENPDETFQLSFS